MEFNCGLEGYILTYVGYPWPCSVQCHFASIVTLVSFPNIRFQNILLFLQIAVKIYQTSPELSSQTSPESSSL